MSEFLSEFLEDFLNSCDEGEKILEASFIELESEAIKAFDAQTIETDKEKFVNEYLNRKGKSMHKKTESYLLELAKDNPSLMSSIQEFIDKGK